MDTPDRIISCLSSALNPEGNNARVATILAGELDVARSTAAAIDDMRNPDHTTGQTLDYVARFFNVARVSGESDESLRSRITTQIKRYYSCGTLSDVRAVVEYFTNLSGDQIQILEPPDVLEGWGFGEGRYGALPWGTPHAIFRVELLADPGPVSLSTLWNIIDLVRAAGVYVQDLIISSSLQTALAAADGATIWDVPTPLRTGFGADGYGSGGYGACPFAVTPAAIAEGDLTISPVASATAGISYGLGFDAGPYGWMGFGGWDTRPDEPCTIADNALTSCALPDYRTMKTLTCDSPAELSEIRYNVYGQGDVRVYVYYDGVEVLFQQHTGIDSAEPIEFACPLDDYIVHPRRPLTAVLKLSGSVTWQPAYNSLLEISGRALAMRPFDCATALWQTQEIAQVEVEAETGAGYTIETPLGFGAGRYGAEPFGSQEVSVDATGSRSVSLVVAPPACGAQAAAASYLGYGGWRYGLYEYGY